jgi:hypothetical protein
MTCVLSVEKKPDGGYGTIRIVTGTESYINTIALAAGGVDLDTDKKVEFVPNSEYTLYIPKDLNFEDVCYQCAVLKQPIHNILRASRYPFDIMVIMMPLTGDDERYEYCTFTQVFLPKSDDNLLAQNISQQTAVEVINTCIKLREDKPFDEIMREVIEDIRRICGADYCSVLLLDDSQRRCQSLGEARTADAGIAWKTKAEDDEFYELAQTWRETMAGSYCLAIRDEHDMEFIRDRNPKWYRSMKEAGVQRLVLFPLIPRGQFLGYIMAVNFDAEDTQHIKDTLELDKRSVAALFGVPSFLVGVGTYNRDEYDNFITTKIMAIAQTLQQEMTRKLLWATDLFFRFSPRSLYAYKLPELISAGAAMVERQAMRRNEWRDWLGLPPDGEMNEIIALENYIPASRLGDQKKLLPEGGDEA